MALGKNLTLEQLVKGIKAQDLGVLAKAITLVESKNPKHQLLAQKLIKEILPLTGKAKRIGISGTPGVGKSTFLENFGMYLINKGSKLAILAVDPTSQLTGGSILGDKTRMTDLSAHSHAFIRPSPNGSSLGGIAAKTREAMLICDAFGFDYIFIETVGVGQSEISVSHIVDMFVLLMQPGSGDELQGIKRGILEVSDLVIVHKADGDSLQSSELAKHDYKKSLEVLKEKSQWKPPVIRSSSITKLGYNEIFDTIDSFFEQYDIELRKAQLKLWMHDLLKEKFSQKLWESKVIDKLTPEVVSGRVDVMSAVEKIFTEVLSDN